MFPAWPFFLYTNPELGKQLLIPLLEHQASGQYPNKWSVHDMGSSYLANTSSSTSILILRVIGSHYPNATGHNDGMQ